MTLLDRVRAWWARLRGRDTFVDSRGRLRWARSIVNGGTATIVLNSPRAHRAFRKALRESSRKLS